MARPAQIEKQTERVKELYAAMGDDIAPVVVEAAPTEENVRPEEPVQVVVSAEDKLLQQHRTLQGMYNAQVPQLQHQLRAAQQSNAELASRLAQLEELAAKPQALETKKYVTAEDTSTFGEDTIDVIRRASREEAEALYVPHIQALQRQVEQLMTVSPRFENVEAQLINDKKTRFLEDLTRVVPNWAEINANPDFKSWLLAVDPYTGRPRQEFLAEAERTFNVSRVAIYFQDWMDILAEEAGHVPSPAQPSPSNDLTLQVVPGRGKAPNIQPKNNTYTREQVAQFFRDVRAGKYVGRDSEKRALEADIFAAQHQQRIL